MDSKADVFCEKCGAKLIDGVCPQCVHEKNVVGNQKDERFKNFFLDPNEQMVTILGNSYLQTFLSSGQTSNGFAVVSNKRTYFRGTSYNVDIGKKEKKKLIRSHQSRTVDLQDITGVGFDSYSDPSWIVRAVLFFVLILFMPCVIGLSKNIGLSFLILFIVAFAYCIFRYYQSKKTYLIIQYAGGAIGFEKNWYSDDEIEQFQQLLMLAKDKVVAENSNKNVSATLETALSSLMDRNSAVNNVSIADEISKLNDLLAKGIISQDEFEKAKKELLK